VNPAGGQVLYWLTWARRSRHNFGLEHAAARARELGKGLVVLEALRAGYPHASPRLHAWVVRGMADTARALRAGGALVHPYLEPAPGAGRGLLRAWAADACLVVTDWYPAFFLPRMLAAAARRLEVRLEAVDSCGLLPLAAAEKAHPTAYAFRRHLQKTLPDHLAQAPEAEPLAGGLPPRPRLPRAISRRWPPARLKTLERADLRGVELSPGPAAVDAAGGQEAGRRALAGFLQERLAGYAENRNQPGRGSRLSPWLHFGQLSPHEVFQELAARESWAPHRLGREAKGKRQGWWGMGADAEAFLDQLVTWRELGYAFCHHRPDYAEYRSLPEWARQTLADHAADPRERLYGLEELEAAETADRVWNAAQRQLRAEGVIESYLRMLWGKRVLEWSPTPEEAWRRLILLNDRWAVDGRDPNSYSGVGWCLGRFDRPFARRPVTGKLRWLSSARARQKLDLADWLERFSR
jgi:deoxyribodipyrimidine photo-lyase